MRIINLDSMVKLISSCKDQVYISLDDLSAFVKGNYKLEDHTLTVNDTVLQLSDRDLNELPSIFHYIKQQFLNEEDFGDDDEA